MWPYYISYVIKSRTQLLRSLRLLWLGQGRGLYKVQGGGGIFRRPRARNGLPPPPPSCALPPQLRQRGAARCLSAVCLHRPTAPQYTIPIGGGACGGGASDALDQCTSPTTTTPSGVMGRKTRIWARDPPPPQERSTSSYAQPLLPATNMSCCVLHSPVLTPAFSASSPLDPGNCGTLPFSSDVNVTLHASRCLCTSRGQVRTTHVITGSSHLRNHKDCGPEHKRSHRVITRRQGRASARGRGVGNGSVSALRKSSPRLGFQLRDLGSAFS